MVQVVHLNADPAWAKRGRLHYKRFYIRPLEVAFHASYQHYWVRKRKGKGEDCKAGQGGEEDKVGQRGKWQNKQSGEQELEGD